MTQLQLRRLSSNIADGGADARQQRTVGPDLAARRDAVDGALFAEQLVGDPHAAPRSG